MNVCSNCLTLNGVQHVYCPACKTLLLGADTLNQQSTTYKSGRLRTKPSKVYTRVIHKMG